MTLSGGRSARHKRAPRMAAFPPPEIEALLNARPLIASEPDTNTRRVGLSGGQALGEYRGLRITGPCYALEMLSFPTARQLIFTL